jgi:3-keto-L-gulonate-6-phosphate decarboxylase
MTDILKYMSTFKLHSFYFLMALLSLLTVSCIPATKTTIGEDFNAGVILSLENSFLRVSNNRVSVNASTNITLTLKDQNGSAYISSRPVITFSKSGGTSVGTLSAVTNLGNGNYSATFTGVTQGTPTTIHAYIDGNEVVGTLPTIEVVSAFSINAPSISIPARSGYSYTFTPAGGVSPYQYQVVSGAGSGSVDAGGVYTAGTRVMSAVVRVTDSIGNQIDSSINLYNSLTNGSISAQVVDSMGNLYVGGSFTRIMPYRAPGALAINTISGSPELGFDLQAGFNGTINAMVRDSSSGAIYVGGDFTTYRGVTVNRIAKLDRYGNLDGSFNGSGFNSTVYALALSDLGDVLYVGGGFTTYRGVANSARYIAKLSTGNGAIDTTFHPVSGTGGFNSVVRTLALNASGDALYVGGSFTTYRGVINSANNITKLSTSNGAIDTTFHPVSATGGFDGGVRTLAINASGDTLYAGGLFTTYRGVANSARYIAKLSTSNGAIDTTFHPVSATGGFDTGVMTLALNASGDTLYAGGYFTTYRGVTNSARNIAKLSTSNGAIDTTFHPVSGTGGFSSSVMTLALNASGDTLYAGGYFTTYRGVTNSARYIAKLSTGNGAIDTTFHPVSASGAFDSYVYALALNASGDTLYAGGSFVTYQGVLASNIAKFDANLEPVDSFNGSGFNGSVSALALNSSGDTLYAGGFFDTYRGVTNSARYIAKLSTSNGAIDTTFHPVSGTGGFSSSVMTLALNASGDTLYAGGYFTTYRGVTNSARYIAKLSTGNGAIDTTFHPVSGTGGFNSSVMTLALNASGDALYVGGGFTAYQGVTTPPIILPSSPPVMVPLIRPFIRSQGREDLTAASGLLP